MAQVSASGAGGMASLGHPEWFINGNTSGIDTYRRAFTDVARISPAVNDVPRVPTLEAIAVFGILWWYGGRIMIVETNHSDGLRYLGTDGSTFCAPEECGWMGPVLERPVKP